MGVPPVKIGPHPFLFLTTAPKRFCMVGTRYFSGKVMHCCRIVNGIKNKNIKNSLDDNMEYWQKVHQIPQNDFGW